MADEACRALALDQDVYQRGRGLVVVDREPPRPIRAGEHGRQPGSPYLAALDYHGVYDRLARVARWQKYNVKTKTWLAAPPNREAVNIVLGRRREGIRSLELVAEAPYLRADGEVVQAPGYDRDSHTLYAPSESFPELPPYMVLHPPSSFTHTETLLHDAEMALRLLREPFAEFEWRDGPDRDVPIACVLTLLARQAIAGSVPMFVLDASSKGSGKGRCADAIAVIATGRRGSRAGWPAEDRERATALGSHALQGTTLLFLDDVTSGLGGGELCKMVTSEGDLVDVRVLGQSRVERVPWLAVVLATGVNVEVLGDADRRAIVARQEPSTARPWERTGFRHPDLIGWVKENRPQLAVAALTILRAYHAAGRPDVGVKLGGFEGWAALVPSALRWAGGEDVVSALWATRGRPDEVLAALRVLVEHWATVDPEGNGLTARELVLTASTQLPIPGKGYAASPVHEALLAIAPERGQRDEVDVNRLGYVLRRHRDSWFDLGYGVGRIVPVEGSDRGSTRWSVELRAVKAAGGARAPNADPTAFPA